MTLIDPVPESGESLVPDAVLASVSDALLICTASGRVVQWSAQAEELLGLSGPELRRTRFVTDLLARHAQTALRDVTHPEGSGKAKLRISCPDEAPPTAFDLEVEVTRIHRAGGSAFCVRLRRTSARGAPDEEAPRHRNAQICVGTASAMMAFDGSALRCVLADDAAVRMFKSTQATLQGAPLHSLQTDLTDAELDRILDKLRRREAPFAVAQTRLRCGDGSTLPIEMRFQLLDSNGPGIVSAVLLDPSRHSATAGFDVDLQARLQRIIAHSPAGIVEADLNGQMTFANARWAEMTGYDNTTLLRMSIFDLTHPESLDATRAAVAALSTGVEEVSLDKTYLRRDGTRLVATSTVAPIRDDAGRFVGISAIVLDTTAKAEAEARLNSSEKHLRRVLDNTVAMIGILALDGTLLEANSPALKGAGLQRDDVIGRKFWDCHWFQHEGADVARLREAVRLAAQGTPQRYDTVIQMEAGEVLDIDFMLSPLFDDHGNVELLVPSGFDISDRKRSEQQLSSLMREVNHRSKNLLTVVQSILRQMRPRDTASFVADFGERLRALSACQDLLVRHPTRSVRLDALIASQLGHLRDLLGTRIRLQGAELTLNADVAQNVGMAIYELSTNAVKYGALSNDVGVIDIRWTVEPREGEVYFNLIWQESGGPDVVEPAAKGFGSVVLGDMVSLVLGASVSTDFVPSGVTWTLECPIRNIAP